MQIVNVGGKYVIKDRDVFENGVEINSYFTTKDPYEDITWVKRTAEIINDKGEIAFKKENLEFPDFWSDRAVNIVAQKYFKNNETSLKQLIDRVVNTICAWGELQHYFADDSSVTNFIDDLKYLIVNQYGTFNSPVWFNVGIDEYPQTSACFINEIKDDMEGILDLVKIEGMIFKSGSGTGMNMSTLRGSNESLSGGGRASGPVSFMEGYDSFAGVIKSGGKTRRSAKLVCLNIDHPDIMEFIKCKSVEERKAKALILQGYDSSFEGEAYKSIKFQNTNISVRLTDEFMSAVNGNKEFWTKNVVDKKPCKKYNAREMLREIARSAWECGDPGVMFDDITNSWNTCKESGKINSSNPCFRGDQRVLTTNGYIKIEQIYNDFHNYNQKMNYKIVSINIDTHEYSYTDPVDLIKKIKRTTNTYYFSDGSEIVCTPTHRFLCERGNFESIHNISLRGGYVCLNEVEQHTKLDYCGITCSSGFKKVKVIGKNYGKKDTVYDITERENHNYIVENKIVHNCGEFLFLDNTACNLASLNLVKFYKVIDNDRSIPPKKSFDYDEFGKAIEIFIIAQDILIDNSSYPSEQIAKNSVEFRPLGLGYTNLGALLMLCGMPYDSDEGRSVTEYITSQLINEAYSTSNLLARKLEPFKHFEKNKESVWNVLRRHGIEVSDNFVVRNAQVVVLAPTGTTSFMLDCDTTGIEPEFSLIKYKRLSGNNGTVKTVNKIVGPSLENMGFDEKTIKNVLDFIENNGTIDGCTDISLTDYQLAVFDCSVSNKKGGRFIRPKAHIDMLESISPYVSGWISKTINLPHESTVDEIMNLYINAWEVGLKSITVYRDGCKDNQPLVTSIKKEEVTTQHKNSPRKKLSETRKSVSHKFEINGQEGYIIVGIYDDGKPGELFVIMSKQGSTISGLMDGFATMVSLALQYGVPLEDLVDKFKLTRFEPNGFTANPQIKIATSIYDYIFRFLESTFIKKDKKQEEKKTEDKKIVDEVKALKKDGPVCTCGSIMSKKGTCFFCEDCGNQSGCS